MLLQHTKLFRMTLEAKTFSTEFDALLFDLDGTVWLEGQALPDAVEAINTAQSPLAYITNNASRGPEVVAKMLGEMGVPTKVSQVLTSAQAAIGLAAEVLSPGDGVLVVGADSFKQLVVNAGYQLAHVAEDKPKAVLHGHNPETGWKQLSEAAIAIQNGAIYVASNVDATLPTPRGFCVGNGSMVAAVTNATGVVPRSAGKPAPAMFQQAAAQFNAKAPLGIGDRLDTDIAGGVAAGCATLHVLTGVSKHHALVHAQKSERPTYVAETLAALAQDPSDFLPQPQGGFTAFRRGQDIIITGGDAASWPQGGHTPATLALRTVLAVAWESEATFTGKVIAESEAAAEALAQWQ